MRVYSFLLNRMRLPKPRVSNERLKGLWSLVVSIATYLSIFLVFVSMAAGLSNGHPGVNIIALMIALAFIPICIFVHEMGHAVAAWLVGWRVHVIVVGSRGFAPRSRRFLRVPRHRRQKDLGGWVHTTPPPGAPPVKGAVTVKLGGSVGNLVVGGMALSIGAMLHDVEMHLHAILLGLGGMSVIYAVRNLIPTWSPGGWISDGAWLLKIFRGERPSSYDRSLSRLYGMMYDGIPAEEWDIATLREVLNSPERDSRTADPLLISHAFGVGDLATARTVLERYLEADPESSFEYRCMYAFAVGMVDRDAVHASEILDSIPNRPAHESFSYWRALAVTQHLLDERDKALEAVRKARHFGTKDGMPPDEDDEMIFGAIEQGGELPYLVPRQRLTASDITSSGTTAEKRAVGADG